MREMDHLLLKVVVLEHEEFQSPLEGQFFVDVKCVRIEAWSESGTLEVVLNASNASSGPFSSVVWDCERSVFVASDNCLHQIIPHSTVAEQAVLLCTTSRATAASSFLPRVERVVVLFRRASSRALAEVAIGYFQRKGMHTRHRLFLSCEPKICHQRQGSWSMESCVDLIHHRRHGAWWTTPM